MPRKKSSKKSTKKGVKSKTKTTPRVKPKKWTTSSVKSDLKRRSILIEDKLESILLEEIPKMRYISATEVAKKYNIRISSAKEFLKVLEEKNLIRLYLNSRNLRIYTSS